MTGINKLPTGWQIGFQSGEANINKFLVVTGDTCIFEFDTANPFASKAIAQQ
jgi:hypothetical protein